MTVQRPRPGRVIAIGAALAAAGVFAVAPVADAAGADSDRDGIPNRWERSHGMNPFKASDARADFDHDGLKNLGEFRRGGILRDEDTDNDGHDDGDEAHDGTPSTVIDDRDTDDDGTRDGDEDSDHDGIDNEDEDDATEPCRGDDDDHDGDHVDDEDENELGDSARDADSDDDGVQDGDEDSDDDGEVNEDEDDDAEDVCSDDSDEDESDLLGTISSFDGTTLVVTTVEGGTVSGVVTEDTEVEVEDSDEEGTVADLQPGVQVAELDFDDETGALDSVEIY